MMVVHMRHAPRIIGSLLLLGSALGLFWYWTNNEMTAALASLDASYQSALVAESAQHAIARTTDTSAATSTATSTESTATSTARVSTQEQRSPMLFLSSSTTEQTH